MKYMAAVLLLVAAMSAQNAPNTNKGDRLDIPAISREANGAVVSIVMSDKNGHPVTQGSGFLISKDGQVVTNYHVIENGTCCIAHNVSLKHSIPLAKTWRKWYRARMDEGRKR